MQTDRLLAPEVADVDGNLEQRRGTVSVFNGPAPVVQMFSAQDAEIAAAGKWIATRQQEGIAPHEIGVFVRCEVNLPRARAAVERAGLPFNLETAVERAAECVRQAGWLEPVPDSIGDATTTRGRPPLGGATTPGGLPCALCRA